MIPENFIKLYESSFRENWDLPALTDYNEQRTLTYEDMAREIAKLHILFRHCQIRRGDKIALVGKNTSNWCIAFMATVSYGAILVPILQEFNPHDYQSFRFGVAVCRRSYLGKYRNGEVTRSEGCYFFAGFFLPRATRWRGDCQVFAGDEAEIQSYLSERFQ